jgi:hypothetical protein
MANSFRRYTHARSSPAVEANCEQSYGSFAGCPIIS